MNWEIEQLVTLEPCRIRKKKKKKKKKYQVALAVLSGDCNQEMLSISRTNYLGGQSLAR